MADNVCGGSTPLKALAEQGARDRSLQQDRARRAVPSPSNFRSNQLGMSRDPSQSYSTYLGNPNQQLSAPHTAEYSGHHVAVHPNAFGTRPQETVHSSQPPQTTNWAQDFDNFRREMVVPSQSSMTTPPSIQHIQHHQHRQNFSPVLSNQAVIARQTPVSMSGMMPLSVYRNQHTPLEKGRDTEFDTAMRHWVTSNGDLGAGVEEQVDAVMDKLARELEDIECAEGQRQSHQARSANGQDDLLVGISHRDALVNNAVLGSLGPELDVASLHVADDTQNMNSMEEVSHHDRAAETPDALPIRSDVSEAARQLLQTVQHEQGDKWKQSQFLLLMKDFRDGQKDIIDNEIRQADT
ncbi:conserved hypothetical protein [Verticillium alfalfae VaMs.102]|uniref:Peroxin 20 n=1 Tax=Verticillium alfalfae (strain VaMs.102 / ATCC MYA-4576 / FGSC 10136) TaxID=526221 RepID=C9STJ5_VERA1|nr:conserved hypothetical protein [Verticillium alfalfae VaMs.102]EEY22110.1 conserved hypothetical protein [Verticillium alfalfae VaMs.102]